MRTAPSIVPGSDQTVFLVEDDFGKIGRAYRETDTAEADLETIIQNLVVGTYTNPVRVISFNTAEGWSQDVSEDIARELRNRHELLGQELPAHLLQFIEKYIGRQLALRLV